MSGFDDVHSDDDFLTCTKSIEECLKEKLSLLPHTKLVIVSALSKMMEMEKIPPETLQVYL